MPDAELGKLKKAAKGLVYTSESDEPLHPFLWDSDGGPLTVAKVLEHGQLDPKSKVEEIPLDDFFATQTASYDGMGDEEKATVAKFASLREILLDSISGVKVYKLGEVNVHYIVVGTTKGGNWAGIWTTAVET